MSSVSEQREDPKKTNQNKNKTKAESIIFICGNDSPLKRDFAAWPELNARQNYLPMAGNWVAGHGGGGGELSQHKRCQFNATSHTLLASKPKHLYSLGSSVYKPLDTVQWSKSQNWLTAEKAFEFLYHTSLSASSKAIDDEHMSEADYIMRISKALESSFRCAVTYQVYNRLGDLYGLY